MAWFGLDCIGVEEKKEMQQLAIRGGPFTANERNALLDYCESDVVALNKLLSRMAPYLDCPGRVCLRGRFMKAAARIEFDGVPIDIRGLEVLRAFWTPIQLQLINRIDPYYGVYDDGHFRLARFADWLKRHSIPWPRTESGMLSTKGESFRLMSRIYPAVAPLHELRATLGQLRLNDLAVGSDGRNRAMLSAFGARSARNTPSSKKFIYGPARWLRALIRPKPGHALAYLDWCSEEFGIGAVLSGDRAMLDAYVSSDPYLRFAQQAGAIPPDGTRETHGHTRDLFKSTCLGLNYGMGANSLSLRIGRSIVEARHFIQLHRETYRKFWDWSDGAVDHAMTYGSLYTVFGWPIQCGSDANSRSLRNFPLQANGSELLRLACCLATERGVRIVAPIHDALLLEARVDEIAEHVAITKAAMCEASRAVLSGFELRIEGFEESKWIRYPNRYMDARGKVMWDTITNIVGELQGSTLSSECSHGQTI
jgi:hypothetical protein